MKVHAQPDPGADFRLNDRERREIAALLHPHIESTRFAKSVNQSVADVAVAKVEAHLRMAFQDITRSGRVAPPAERRDRHLEVANLSRQLVALLRDRTLFGGGAILAYTADFPEVDQESIPFQRQWIRCLLYLQDRCEKAAKTGELPGIPKDFDRHWLLRFKGDELRNDLSARMLDLFLSETGQRPTTYEDGGAVLFLRATVSPALQFARDKLGYVVKSKPGRDAALSATCAKDFIRAYNRNHT